MRSAQADELTTRARILGAALDRFARSGFAAGLRTIAADAGVSAGLVVHHFGSKQGLRDACDEHVLAVIRENKTSAMTTEDPQTLLSRMLVLEEFAPLMLYVLRTLQAGDDTAARFVEHFVKDAEVYLAAGVAAGRIKPSRDTAARARYLTYLGLGGMLVQLMVEQPDLDAVEIGALFRRIVETTAMPALELYTEGLFTDRRMLDAYLEFVPDPPAGAPSPDRPAPATEGQLP